MTGGREWTAGMSGKRGVSFSARAVETVGVVEMEEGDGAAPRDWREKTPQDTPRAGTAVRVETEGMEGRPGQEGMLERAER